jgi:hypothetical protein
MHLIGGDWVTGMQRQLGNLETISTFFNLSNQKFQHLHGDTGKPRKCGSITRKKVTALPYAMVSDFHKQKTLLFESSQTSPVCLSGKSNM